MRQIAVTTEVFAMIWSLRQEGEDSEDEVLRRVLDRHPSEGVGSLSTSYSSDQKLSQNRSSRNAAGRKIRWIDDVLQTMLDLDREAHLSEIYENVRKLRSTAHRTVPSSYEAIIRRTLEEHCPETESFKGDRLFKMTRGKWAGYWAVRSTK